MWVKVKVQRTGIVFVAVMFWGIITTDMKQKEFENITNRMIAESVLDSELLKDFTSYVIFNCDGLEEPTIFFQKEVRDCGGCVLFQLHEPSEAELALRKRIEEARRLETFSDMLLRLIREAHKTAPEVYKAAGVDSRHFSKINSRRNYKPSKETVYAFAIALHLSVSETEELLEKAGFAFSSSSIFDVSIKYFLEKHIYDRGKIDIIMDNLGLSLLPQNF